MRRSWGATLVVPKHILTGSKAQVKQTHCMTPMTLFHRHPYTLTQAVAHARIQNETVADKHMRMPTYASAYM